MRNTTHAVRLPQKELGTPPCVMADLVVRGLGCFLCVSQLLQRHSSFEKDAPCSQIVVDDFLMRRHD